MIDRRTLRAKTIEDSVPVDPDSLARQAIRYLRGLEAKGYSRHTLRSRSAHLRYFLVWFNDTGHRRLKDVTRCVLENYAIEVHHLGRETGRALSCHTKHDRLANVFRFIRWLANEGCADRDLTVGLPLPRCSRRLPKTVLTANEAEKVLAQPDVSTTLGLRDRAILELLYATGLRRQELIDLDQTSIDMARRVVTVLLGKGRKDRVVPFNRRVAGWLARYMSISRPELTGSPPDKALFLTTHKGPMSPERLTILVHRYVDAANIGKTGSCHLFRHTMATLMLEGGADLRFVQAMLGHADISTTQIYTRVATQTLSRVHERTHPSTAATQRKKRTRRKPPASGLRPPGCKPPRRRSRAKLKK
jgi:integrase/recombinase XerD